MTKKTMPGIIPRTRKGSHNYFKKCLGLKDAFFLYRKELEEMDMEDHGIKDSILYKKICMAANKKIMQRIIEGAETFVLPFRLGEIRIRKRLMTQVTTHLVNWPASIKLGKVVYWSNEHSGGFLMKFYWDKYFGRVTNLHTYSFQAIKINRQWLGRTIRNNPRIDYYE